VPSYQVPDHMSCTRVEYTHKPRKYSCLTFLIVCCIFVVMSILAVEYVLSIIDVNIFRD